MGAGAAGTVYRVKHKTEGGEVVFSMQLYLYAFVFRIFVFSMLYLCIFYLSQYTKQDKMDGGRVGDNDKSKHLKGRFGAVCLLVSNYLGSERLSLYT